MNKLLLLITLLASIASFSYAGCMTKQIDTVNAKLEVAELSPELKKEALRLRDLIIENEHSDRDSADKFYNEVIDILG